MHAEPEGSYDGTLGSYSLLPHLWWIPTSERCCTIHMLSWAFSKKVMYVKCAYYSKFKTIRILPHIPARVYGTRAHVPRKTRVWHVHMTPYEHVCCWYWASGIVEGSILEGLNPINHWAARENESSLVNIQCERLIKATVLMRHTHIARHRNKLAKRPPLKQQEVDICIESIVHHKNPFHACRCSACMHLHRERDTHT